MTGFAFRLQPLLKLRIAKRDRCREELANAFRADQILQQQMESVREEIQRTRHSSREGSQPGRVAVDHLLHTHRYELLLRSQVQQLAAQRQQVAEEIERRRQALVDGDREVRILEKLREAQYREYWQEENRRELRQMDEVALRRVASSREHKSW